MENTKYIKEMTEIFSQYSMRLDDRQNIWNIAQRFAKDYHASRIEKKLPNREDKTYISHRDEICFQAWKTMPMHLTRKMVENGFDIGFSYAIQNLKS